MVMSGEIRGSAYVSWTWVTAPQHQPEGEPLEVLISADFRPQVENSRSLRAAEALASRIDAGVTSAGPLPKPSVGPAEMSKTLKSHTPVV